MDQISSELPYLPRTEWAKEMEEAGVSDEAQPVPRISISGESGGTTSDKGSLSAPELPLKKKHRARQAPCDIRRKKRHAEEYRDLGVQQAVASAKYFTDYREQRHQKTTQGLPINDARHRIAYQFNSRIMDPNERKPYRQIPLVTEEDQQ